MIILRRSSPKLSSSQNKFFLEDPTSSRASSSFAVLNTKKSMTRKKKKWKWYKKARNQEKKNNRYRYIYNTDIGVIRLKVSVINISSRSYNKMNNFRKGQKRPSPDSNGKCRTSKYPKLRDQWICLTSDWIQLER